MQEFSVVASIVCLRDLPNFWSVSYQGKWVQVLEIQKSQDDHLLLF